MAGLEDADLIEELRARFRSKDAALLALRAATGKLEEINRRLLESERLKGRFLANVRNEITNPLASIQGIARELGTGEIADPADVRAFATTIVNESAALAFQLRNIFTAAEIEAGEAVPAIAQVDAGRVVAAAAGGFRDLAASRRIALVISWDRGGGCGTFCTDAGMLHTIVENLVSNAVKFSGDGGWVTVQGAHRDDRLVLSVRDRGRGIAPGEQERLFERFRPCGEGSGRSHGGQGLGLSVVRALVELLGGTLGIESTPGSGSAFTVRLPEAQHGAASDFADAGNEVFFAEEWF